MSVIHVRIATNFQQVAVETHALKVPMLQVFPQAQVSVWKRQSFRHMFKCSVRPGADSAFPQGVLLRFRSPPAAPDPRA